VIHSWDHFLPDPTEVDFRGSNCWEGRPVDWTEPNGGSRGPSLLAKSSLPFSVPLLPGGGEIALALFPEYGTLTFALYVPLEVPPTRHIPCASTPRLPDCSGARGCDCQGSRRHINCCIDRRLRGSFRPSFFHIRTPAPADQPTYPDDISPRAAPQHVASFDGSGMTDTPEVPGQYSINLEGRGSTRNGMAWGKECMLFLACPRRRTHADHTRSWAGLRPHRASGDHPLPSR
jgi:hypothetical protein